ncbi:MAG: DEAD/DEAH box helicase family protein [Bacteroidales bacterium]|nr:DEAD/DEAH box helicase family protein [Bacteroidales bacterium]
MKAHNFITNSGTKNLQERISQLVRQSNELKFLAGFFYFSGLRELYEGMKTNPDFLLKVLAGIRVDVINSRLVETDYSENISDEEKIEVFFESIRKSINTDSFDTRDFYEQSRYFIGLIQSGKMIIRKTYEPNHSKLYLFKLREEQIARNRLFITGSSNLTKAGLTTQNEFNVEISDYGFDEAENYFDSLWDKAVLINEKDDIKKKLIEVLEQETLIKELTPFEAYALVLKSYLETYQHKDISTIIIQLLEKNNYKQYKYQLDAIKQAVAVIEANNGVLVADVVGLGKTIIACAVARQLRVRGIVICPPGLIGDENKTEGWKKYLEQFELYDWEVRSSGDLEKAFEYIKDKNDFELVIVDEAHRFRNQDTKNYELLKNICRNRRVILLTATPFNNKPQDVLSLLNLFIIPKKSTITLDTNLIDTFRELNKIFEHLAYIKKNHSSADAYKKNRATELYKILFNEQTVDLKKVKRKSEFLAKQIRDVIEPVTIRRNRLDLQKNPDYRQEVQELSEVENPIEGFYELSPEQSKFYDRVINEFFADPGEGGKFRGTIYRPFEYEEGIVYTEVEKSVGDKEKNRELIQQRNLFDIMRRLIVKRFESSFGAFKKTIGRFIEINKDVLKFIEKTGNGDVFKGEYILDRDLLENILELDNDEIELRLKEYEELIKKGEYPKKHKRYKIEKFKWKEQFISDIKSDISLFEKIIEELGKQKLVENDPKALKLYEYVTEEITKEPSVGEPLRKVVIFSEYADTVKHLKEKFDEFDKKLSDRTLVVTGALPQSKLREIIENFDASATKQKNNYDVLLSTDKLSEGFNLNRAGMVINYDIPWNPVRVIQRLGRINRISKKVFDKLYIRNFFPTQKGADLVRSREIAQNKMFMIHNTLGEDSKIFDIDEEPSPAGLYQKLTQNPETGDEECFYTKIVNLYHEIKLNNPETIEKLQDVPRRIKVIKKSDENEMLVFFKKNRLFVKQALEEENKINVTDTSLEMILDKITCRPETESIRIDENFWRLYEKIKQNNEKPITTAPPISIEKNALGVIDFLLRQKENPDLVMLKPFLRTLREDILDYGTLPDYTLRRIANLSNNKSGINISEAITELGKLEKELGRNYLDQEKNMQHPDKEIIIAIENRNT